MTSTTVVVARKDGEHIEVTLHRSGTLSLTHVVESTGQTSFVIEPENEVDLFELLVEAQLKTVRGQR